MSREMKADSNEKNVTALEMAEIRKNLERMVEDLGDDDDSVAMINDALNAVDAEFKHKVDALAHVRTTLLGKVDSITMEANSLLARADGLKKRVKRLDEYIMSVATTLGMDKLEGASRTITVAKNGGPAVAVPKDGVADDVALEKAKEIGAINLVINEATLREDIKSGSVPERYVTPVISRQKLAEEIASGNPLASEFFQIAERGRHIRVR